MQKNELVNLLQAELGFIIRLNHEGRPVVIYPDGFQKPASPTEVTLWTALINARGIGSAS